MIGTMMVTVAGALNAGPSFTTNWNV